MYMKGKLIKLSEESIEYLCDFVTLFLLKGSPYINHKGQIDKFNYIKVKT